MSDLFLHIHISLLHYIPFVVNAVLTLKTSAALLSLSNSTSSVDLPGMLQGLFSQTFCAADGPNMRGCLLSVG